MFLIEFGGEWFRIDGIGKKTVHLERVEFNDRAERKENGDLNYTEDYREISRKELADIIQTHLSAMREQEKEFQKQLR